MCTEAFVESCRTFISTYGAHAVPRPSSGFAVFALTEASGVRSTQLCRSARTTGLDSRCGIARLVATQAHPSSGCAAACRGAGRLD